MLIDGYGMVFQDFERGRGRGGDEGAGVDCAFEGQRHVVGEDFARSKEELGTGCKLGCIEDIDTYICAL